MGNRAITEPLALTTDYVSIDGRYTDANGNPYASVAAAETALGRRMNQYTVGLTVLVKESGWNEAKEYWVQPKGTTPETYGLVPKSVNLTTKTELSKEEKYYASANVSDRSAVVVAETGVVESLGYRVLSPNLSFAEQVTAANTIYEIKDSFDLGGEWKNIDCNEPFTYRTKSMYISNSPVSLLTDDVLTYEKGFYLVKNVSETEIPDYIVIDSSGSYIAEEEESVYFANYGYLPFGGVRYQINNGTPVEINFNNTNTTSKNITNIYYGYAYTIPANKSIYLKANEYLFSSDKSTFIQKGGVYTPSNNSVDTDVYIAMTFNGSNKVFESHIVELPLNSFLVFNGGRICNGILNSNRIYVKSDRKGFSNIYFTTLSTFANKEVLCSWFLDEGEDCSEILTSLFRIDVKSVIDDLHYLYATHPIIIAGRSKQFRGIGNISRNDWDVTKSDCSGIYAHDDWSADGYSKNAIVVVEGTQAKGLINSILFCGNKDRTGYLNDIPFKVNYGIYYKSVLAGAIDNCAFTQFATTAIRLTAVEDGTVSNCLAYANGSFIIATNYYINEYNPIVGLNGMSEGDNPISLFKMYNNYTGRMNFGALIHPGTDVYIEKNSLSHTSIGGLYVFSGTNVVDIRGNYFEGCGTSAFWIDANGYHGCKEDIIPNNVQMCDYLKNPHRGEAGRWFSSGGWGLYVGNGTVGVILRSCITFFGTSQSIQGGCTIISNFFSSFWIRSTISGGLDYTETKTGLDSIVHVGTMSTIIGSFGTQFSSNSLPYYYIVSDMQRFNSSPMDITVLNMPSPYLSHKNWFRTLGNNHSANIRINYLQNSDFKGNPNCVDIITRVSSAINGVYSVAVTPIKNIDEISSYYKTINNRNYYSMPTYSNNTRGISTYIPFSHFDDGPRIIEVNILNESQNTYVPQFHLQYNTTSNQSTFTDIPASIFGTYQEPIPKDTNRRLYFFISKDLFKGISEIKDIRLQIAGSANLADEIYVTPAYMRYIGKELVTNIEFDGYDKYGYRTYGATSNRPIISQHLTEPIRYFDTTLGKPIFWNGSSWTDANGETVGLQVSDTSVLIGAAGNSVTINVYHANALTVSALNPDNTRATWLTVPSTIAVGTNTLTISAAANTASNPRGAKVIISDGTDVVIVNVVQNYSTT